MLVTKSTTFEAAHRLPGHRGKCDRLHGHHESHGGADSIDGTGLSRYGHMRRALAGGDGQGRLL